MAVPDRQGHRSSVSPATPTSTRGPIQVDGEVLTVKRQGAYRQVTLVAAGVAERFRPGSFVAVSVGDPAISGRLARRAFWIQQVSPVGSRGATLDLVVEPTGVGSRWLAEREPGAAVTLTGPLGRPFALPREPVTCLLVGEGYAAAALFPLAERLRDRGCVVSMVTAAPDEARLLGTTQLRRLVRSMTVVTGDGSVGRHGVVADVLPELVERSGADVLYAAGPRRTLHAAAAAAEQAGAWSQTALEVHQPCATGLCQGCPVPVVGEDGIGRTVRGCHDGPVFRGDRVRWDEVPAW